MIIPTWILIIMFYNFKGIETQVIEFKTREACLSFDAELRTKLSAHYKSLCLKKEN